MKKISVKVEFGVFMQCESDTNAYNFCKLIAEHLSVSLTLKDMRVYKCTVGGFEFNLDKMRNIDKRCP